MALYLVQHGKSLPREEDRNKGLSDQGVEQTIRIAEVARGYKVKVNKIVHSGKKRAEQTAEIMHQALASGSKMEVMPGLNPLDDVQSFAKQLIPAQDLLVVGHLPFMERLVSFLTTGIVDNRVYSFQNSGIVCLDAESGEGKKLDWFIRWTLNPDIS